VSQLQRLRRRRRTRGAAMIEGVVAIPFLMLMLAGTVFVGGFYGQRIDAQMEARQGTWMLAVNENCDNESANYTTLPGLEIVDSADLKELSASPLAALCNKDFGSVTWEARRAYNVDGAFSFASGDIRAKAMCPCNESPVSGDVAYESAVEFLWTAYQNRGTAPPTPRFATLFPIGRIFGSGFMY
jgi:hypothetical protein